jgi:pimeloyl-ACP methyl ester carboxylesterase
MAARDIKVERRIAVGADDVWAVAGDFCGAWHPFVDWIESEQGGMVRRFGVKGETGHYRERLTYFSDCDTELRYEMLEGISGAQSYAACLKVRPDGPYHCTVTWTAHIVADESRATQIAEGTAAVFEAGIAALAATQVASISLPGAPRLCASVGPASPGPLVVFLHGIGGGRQNWRRQQIAIADRCQTAALDLRGYGDSARGEEQSRVDDYCDDILRVMKHFGRDEVILCGLSYGAWIATSFAMRYPGKLRALVLSGGSTGMSEASAAEREAFFASRQKPLDEGKTPADFASAVVNIIAGPGVDEATQHLLHQSMAAIPTATYRDAVYCFTHPEGTFDFSKITCPVLMMTGEHDRLASPTEIRAVANRIHKACPQADVRFEVIAKAGHVCNLEQPDQYNAILTQFLQRFTP